MPSLLGGGSWLRFKHPVVRCRVLTYAHLLFSLSPYYSHLPPWATHQLSVQKMFGDRTEPTFRAETVPETVLVLSLITTAAVVLLIVAVSS